MASSIKKLCSTDANRSYSGSDGSWQKINAGLTIDNSGNDFWRSPRSNASYTDWLQASDYGFSIPAGATIQGIEVTIDREGSNATDVYDYELRLLKSNDTLGTSDKADTTTPWTSSFTTKTYGSSIDTWGDSWTDSDINSSNFGVVLSIKEDATLVRGSVNYIQVTVYYTEGSIESFTKLSNSTIQTTKTKTDTSNSRVKNINSTTKTSNARIKKVGNATKSTNARIKQICDPNKPANARIKIGKNITKPNNAYIDIVAWTETSWQSPFNTNDEYSQGISGLDSNTQYEFQTKIKNSAGESDWTTSETFTTLSSAQITKPSNARIKVSKTITKTSNARIKISNTLTKPSNAKIKSSQSITKPANAKISTAGTILKNANATIKLTKTKTINSNARIKIIKANTDTANARVKITDSITKSSNATIKISNSITKTSNARVKITDSLTKPSDANIKASQTKTTTSNASVDIAGTITKQANARIKISQTKTVTTNARLKISKTITKPSNARILAGLNIKIMINSEWKDVADIKIKRGEWKDIATVKPRIDSEWKTT